MVKPGLSPISAPGSAYKPSPAGVLVEPFAGGGIIGLTAGFEGLAEHVVLAERDHNVAAVWLTILGGQAKWLADQILSFDLTREKVAAVLRKEATSQRERAFAVILRNRVQRGGIMAEGAGLVKTGENGRGLNSRWYPETIARRIQEIAGVREQFSFVEGDGFEVIRRYADDERAAFFADPPYTVASKRLYPHWQVDHRSLFGLLANVKGDVLLTYDNTREIASLASEFRFETQAIAMKNTHHAKMTELVIGKDSVLAQKRCNRSRIWPSNRSSDMGVPPVSPSTALPRVVKWVASRWMEKRPPFAGANDTTNQTISQLDKSLTSRISPSEFQNALSITTAIFFPHRLIVGTLICNCGISRLGPDERKSGRR